MARSGRSGVRRLLTFTLVLSLVAGLVVLGQRVWEAGQRLVAPSPYCEATSGKTTFSVEPEQMGNVALISSIALRRKLPTRAAWIALATARQESKYRNITYGDRDSLGLFQQRPSQDWGTAAEVQNPVYATNAFYDALVKIKGYEQLELTIAAQRVQRSAFPDAYAQHAAEAQVFANVLTGNAEAALTCTLDRDWAPTGRAGVAPFLAAVKAERPPVTASALPEGTGVRLTSQGVPGWQLAHWAVGSAQRLGVGRVYVDGRRWSRANSADGWTADGEGGSGVVVMFTDSVP
jgi:hypothetical protein